MCGMTYVEGIIVLEKWKYTEKLFKELHILHWKKILAGRELQSSRKTWKTG